MTQYVIFCIWKHELKEAVKTSKEIFGKANWFHIFYATAPAPLYIIETKEAAIKHVQNENRTSTFRTYFFLELSTYKQ